MKKVSRRERSEDAGFAKKIILQSILFNSSFEYVYPKFFRVFSVFSGKKL